LFSSDLPEFSQKPIRKYSERERERERERVRVLEVRFGSVIVTVTLAHTSA
jgi:hypothetical protein